MLKKKPVFRPRRILSACEKDSGVEKAIIRLPIPQVSATRFRRRQAVEIKNETTGLSTVCFVMGGNLAHDQFAVDYDSRQLVGLKYSVLDVDNIVIRPASYFRLMRYYLNHPDAGHRISIQLGMLGATLGGLSAAKDLIEAVFSLLG